MKVLKEIVLKLKLSFSNKKDKVERKAVPLESASHIGLLINTSNLNEAEAINDFAKSLIKEGKKVSALAFFSSNKTIHFDFPCTYQTWKDLDWKGDFDKEIIHTYTKTPFDFLYSINIFPILPFNYLLWKSHAKCRVGAYSSNAPLDLMIQNPEKRDLSFLIEQMNKYTRKIKTGK